MKIVSSQKMLEVPDEHRVPLKAVQQLEWYIIGCQPEVVGEHQRSGYQETPPNINWHSLIKARQTLKEFNVKQGITPTPEQAARWLFYATKCAKEEMTKLGVAEVLVVPEAFNDIGENVWQYAAEYYEQRAEEATATNPFS